MHELGIRHALRRGATVLLTSTLLPFDITQNYALGYAGARRRPGTDATGGSAAPEDRAREEEKRSARWARARLLRRSARTNRIGRASVLPTADT
jgi:hypothetical protein